MTTTTFNRFRLGLALAAALSSFTALAAGGSPSVSFNGGAAWGVNAVGVGESAGSSPDPMLVNTSSSPAVISAITFSGTNPSEFSASGSATAPCAVGTTIDRSGTTGNFCGLHFTFRPTSLGFKSAIATVTFTNAASASIPMTGQAVVAAASLNVQTFPNPFVNVPVSTAGPAVTVAVVSNPGAHNLAINSVTVSGLNAADFVLSPVIRRGAGPSCATPGTILSSALSPTCAIGVSFRPSALGVRSATVTVATSDPAHPIVTIPMSATGVVAPPPPPPVPAVSAAYFTDLWWNPAEPAWSLNIVHHKQLFVGGPGSDAVIATWNTFNANATPTWVTLSSGNWTSPQTYTGVLHQTTGSYFGSPYLPGQAVDSVVGSATLTFTDANNGTLVYTLSGITSSRAITRKPF